MSDYHTLKRILTWDYNVVRKVVYNTLKIKDLDAEIAIRVTPVNSAEIQKFAFSIGYLWAGTEVGIQYTDRSVLYFDTVRKIITVGNYIDHSKCGKLEYELDNDRLWVVIDKCVPYGIDNSVAYEDMRLLNIDEILYNPDDHDFTDDDTIDLT